MVAYPGDIIEYSEIKEIYRRVKGTPITAEKMHRIKSSTGSIRVFAGGATEIKANLSDLPDANIVNVPVVIVQSRGVIDFIYCDEPCTFKNEMWGYTSADLYAVKFLFYYLKYNVDYFRNAGDGRSSFPQISLPVTEEYKVPLIHSKEQQAIATVLSDFDEHIDNLTKLIDKKIAIRIGALEDLLSGRTRLGGFKGQWEKIPFNQYFTLLPTNTYSRERLSERGAVGNIHYGDILTKYGCVLTEKDHIPRIIDTSNLNKRHFLKKNDIIIADTAEDDVVGKAVQIGDINMPIVSGLHTMACRPNYPTAFGFLGYYINSNCYHDQLLPYVTGIKVSSISKKSIGETELCIPVNVKEQQAISSILYEMDEDIKLLEIEKTKMVQIRDGAMDDLLTGRVRLKV